MTLFILSDFAFCFIKLIYFVKYFSEVNFQNSISRVSQGGSVFLWKFSLRSLLGNFPFVPFLEIFPSFPQRFHYVPLFSKLAYMFACFPLFFGFVPMFPFQNMPSSLESRDPEIPEY